MTQSDDGRFPTTQWTLIARLKSEDEAESQAALDELCTRYHYPLYCYIRWRGLNHHDAQDALHDFLARLLRLGSLKTADLEKGRLRTFLATALQRFLINRRRDDRHRAGELSLDEDIEERFAREGFADGLTPEKVLDRSWAAAVLRGALQDLAHAEEEAGRGTQLRVLEPFLSPSGAASADYAAAAERLGQSESTTRQNTKRLRDRFRTHLRKRVAETLGRPTAERIDEEMKVLRAAME